MKINDNIFSFPPYISTNWANISALYVKDGGLLIALKEGEIVTIPGLSTDLIDLIFRNHAAYLEKKGHTDSMEPRLPVGFAQGGAIQEFPFRIGLGSLDGIGAAMQHNPAQASMPDLPAELVNKIASIAKIVAPEDPSATFPKPEPHCNCPFCQIARAVNQTSEEPEEKNAPEEIVADAELQFQEWSIEQTGDKLFTVSNRLDTREKYSVYLGHPVGCTCGKQGCEHILAVLKS